MEVRWSVYQRASFLIFERSWSIRSAWSNPLSKTKFSFGVLRDRSELANLPWKNPWAEFSAFVISLMLEAALKTEKNTVAEEESGLSLISIIVTPEKTGLLLDFRRIEESFIFIISFFLLWLIVAIARVRSIPFSSPNNKRGGYPTRATDRLHNQKENVSVQRNFYQNAKDIPFYEPSKPEMATSALYTTLRVSRNITPSTRWTWRIAKQHRCESGTRNKRLSFRLTVNWQTAKERYNFAAVSSRK